MSLSDQFNTSAITTLQKAMGVVVQGTSKTNFDTKSINADKLLFCDEQCLEYYDGNRNQNLDLLLIIEEVIDHVMMPLLEVKVLQYLKCTNSQWKTKLKEYTEKSLPMFKFITNFGSKGSENGNFDYPFFVTTENKVVFMYVIVLITEFRY